MRCMEIVEMHARSMQLMGTARTHAATAVPSAMILHAYSTHTVCILYAYSMHTLEYARSYA